MFQDQAEKHFSAIGLFLLIFQEGPHCEEKSTERVRYVIQRHTVDVTVLTRSNSGDFHHEIRIEHIDFSNHPFEGKTILFSVKL